MNMGLRIGLKGKGLEEAVFAGAGNGFETTVDVQLLVDIANVPLHRAEGDDQLIGDGLIGHPTGNEAEDLNLAVSQRLGKIGQRSRTHWRGSLRRRGMGNGRRGRLRRRVRETSQQFIYIGQ